MLIKKFCQMCNTYNYMIMSKDQTEEYKKYIVYGGFIQDSLPSFNKFEREFIKTGYCPDCQEKIFRSKLKDKSNFFSENVLNDNHLSDFFEKIGDMDFSDAIQSEYADIFSDNEKLAFLHEYELEDSLYLDPDAGVKKFEE